MELITFLSRSFFILFLFWLLYQLFLRNDAHYKANRFYLLLGLAAAVILPFVEVNYTVLVQSVENNYGSVPISQNHTQAENIVVDNDASINWTFISLCAYLSVVGFFVFRLLWHCFKMLLMIKSSKIVMVEGTVVCIHPKVDTAFVFGKRIFIKNEDYLKVQNAEILNHEMVHLKQQHWIDVLSGELLLAFQWFNPLAWYYVRIVKENLEFLADQGVLNKGFRMETYIQHIICETMGAEASVLANHFRFSQNKRRLKMMKNNRKSKWRLLKLLLVLPLIGGLLWAFSEPVYEYRSGTELASESPFKEEKDVYVVKGKVKGDENSPLPGTSIVLKGKTIGTVADMKGEFELEVTNEDVIVFSFVGFETIQVKPEKGKELLVKLKKTSYDLDPSSYRDKYKGKQTPPPPPPKKIKANDVPPPPVKDEKPVFYVVEDMPKYKGGMDAYYANLYTRVAFYKQKQKDLSGTVRVQFKVDAKGDVSEVKALDAPNKKAEKMAVLVVSELDDWKPGKQRGKAVSTTLVVPVEFE